MRFPIKLSDFSAMTEKDIKTNSWKANENEASSVDA
jgi:hypothetical protein